MLEKVTKHKFQILSILFAVVGFALIRNYEDQLFYDPFLNFFKGISSQRSYPDVIKWKLYLHSFLRYFLNTILSLLIIYSLFKNKDYVKLACIMYVLFFIILIVLLSIAINFFSDRFMFLFYTRRFIIQPMFLLLFVPGFYFQQQHFKK